MRPLIVHEDSRFLGAEHLRTIEDLLAKGENVVFFSNHQTEADPPVRITRPCVKIIMRNEKVQNILPTEIIFVYTLGGFYYVGEKWFWIFGGESYFRCWAQSNDRPRGYSLFYGKSCWVFQFILCVDHHVLHFYVNVYLRRSNLSTYYTVQESLINSLKITCAFYICTL